MIIIQDKNELKKYFEWVLFHAIKLIKVEGSPFLFNQV